jgi:hypothetical protein
LDFHFSLLRCLDDVDDNDGCTTEKKRRGWERQRVICVPSWVWYVYGCIATMLVCGLCMGLSSNLGLGLELSFSGWVGFVAVSFSWLKNQELFGL